uniref:Uncharacterized protein n=1 Tax=Anopheles melas TaxID=34690 RepID=A0A182U7W2_9DIPT
MWSVKGRNSCGTCDQAFIKPIIGPMYCANPNVPVRFLIELFRKQQIELRLIIAQKLHHIIPSERILGRLKAQRIQKVHQHLVHRDVVGDDGYLMAPIEQLLQDGTDHHPVATPREHIHGKDPCSKRRRKSGGSNKTYQREKMLISGAGEESKVVD